MPAGPVTVDPAAPSLGGGPHAARPGGRVSSSRSSSLSETVASSLGRAEPTSGGPDAKDLGRVHDAKPDAGAEHRRHENSSIDVDVAIVGGSLAGCAAAHRLAREGLRVAVVEKSPDPLAYKRLCGHFIQAGATAGDRAARPRRPASRRAGGVRNARRRVHARSGGSGARRRSPHGYSIRRVKLDPLVRRLADRDAGRHLPRRPRCATRSATAGGDGRRRARPRRAPAAFRARLVVGADGRHSTVARLAGVPAASVPNDRFCYFAYYAGLEEPGRVWRGAGATSSWPSPTTTGSRSSRRSSHRDGLRGVRRPIRRRASSGRPARSRTAPRRRPGAARLEGPRLQGPREPLAAPAPGAGASRSSATPR